MQSPQPNTPLLALRGAGCAAPNQAPVRGVSLEIHPGQCVALLGPAGGGKSAVLQMAAGLLTPLEGARIAADGLRAAYLGFDPRQEAAVRRADFFQMRWHSWEGDDAEPARDLLGPLGDEAPALLSALGLAPLLDRAVLQLSTGELRRLRVAAALLHRPDLVCLDDPFGGLDAPGRAAMARLLDAANARGQALLLACPRPQELPRCATGALCLNAGAVAWAGPLADMPQGAWLAPAASRPAPPALPPCAPQAPAPEPLVLLRNGHVAYGGRPVLAGVDWEVRAGQRWRVEGGNGSGKSTLLALVNGDHPQAYANDLALFGRPRGTGESIWELKARMGMVDPAMEAYFNPMMPLRDVALSGLSDSLAAQARFEDEAWLAEEWMQALGLDGDARFGESPFSARRLALLARALIKRPALLLADEACRGLDAAGRGAVLACVEQACRQGLPALVWVSHHDDECPQGLTHRLALETPSQG